MVVAIDHLERDGLVGAAELRGERLDVCRWCRAVATAVDERDRGSDPLEVRGKAVLDDDVAKRAAV